MMELSFENSDGSACRDRTAFPPLLGICWFWLYAALLLGQLPFFVRSVLAGSEGALTLLLVALMSGIGLGTMLCRKISGKHAEIGLVCVGSFGLTVFGLDLYFACTSVPAAGAPSPLAVLLALASTWRLLFDFLAIGAFGGFFAVTLYALLPRHGQPEPRARIVAAGIILIALFLAAGTLATEARLALGTSIPTLIAIAALFNGLIAVLSYRLAPEYAIRFFASILIHACYRLEKTGLDRIPSDGPAVLVCNHVSLADAVVLLAAVRRPLRFLMTHRIYRKPGLNYFCRQIGAIPIAPAAENVAMRDAAFVEMAKALRKGELVAIFPEGKLTRDGELGRFRYGVQRVVNETPVPVLPMALRGLWGSFFSLRHGPVMSRPSTIRWRRKIELVAGKAVPPEKVTPEYLQCVVEALRGENR